MVKFEILQLFQLRMPLIHPFRTSFGTQNNKEAIILKLSALNNEESAFGEIPLTSNPGYCYETINTAWHIITDFIVPKFIQINRNSDNTVDEWIQKYNIQNNFIRGHNFAKSGLEFCLWNMKANLENKSLWKVLSTTKTSIPTGISIGIQKSKIDLLKKVTNALEQNYKRIKIKIEPKNDLELISYLRKELGDFLLMVDANSSYSLKDLPLFKKLDKFDLMMIEQPLGFDDLIDHSLLQKEISTPICLDESIHNLEDVRKAISIGACKVINIKDARVGGLSESIKIAEYCHKNGIDVWCGGMLESGIGRIMNIALQANDYFTLPGDTSASKRYFHEDIINPEVIVNKNGTINVQTEYSIKEEKIFQFSTKKTDIKLL